MTALRARVDWRGGVSSFVLVSGSIRPCPRFRVDHFPWPFVFPVDFLLSQLACLLRLPCRLSRCSIQQIVFSSVFAGDLIVVLAVRLARARLSLCTFGLSAPMGRPLIVRC